MVFGMIWRIFDGFWDDLGFYDGFWDDLEDFMMVFGMIWRIST